MNLLFTTVAWYANTLNEHAPYKRGVPWAKMALEKYLTYQKIAVQIAL